MASMKVTMDKEDYISVQNLRKSISRKHGLDIGWISAYRNWKKMGYPKM